jgi:hypothetical protein
MPYNNVDALLKSGKNVDEIVYYDFKNENENISQGKHNIDFWIEYRKMNYNKNNKENNKKITKKIWDCDGSGRNSKDTCSLSRDIYKVIWGWENKIESSCKCTSSFYNSCMEPDSMNSYFKILTRVIDLVEPDGKKDYFQIVNKSHHVQKRHWSKKDIGEWGGEFFKDLVEKVRKNKEVGCLLNKFAKLTHTMGNFVLVPAGFNKGRVRSTADYWDLSLKILKTDSDWIPPEFFQKYINTFFLWDYVDENYEIKLFFKEHGFKKLQPSNIEEAVEFLQKVTKFIVRRGYFMLAMLMVKTKFEEKYTKILNEISNINKADMEEALKIIETSVNDEPEISNILNKIRHPKIKYEKDIENTHPTN